MGTGSAPSTDIHLTNRQIYSISFINNLCIAVLYLTLPLQAIALGADAFQLGLVGTVWSLSAICSAVLCGKLSDRVGRDLPMTLGPLLSGLATLSLLFLPHLFHVFVVASAMGIASALFWPSVEARVADVSGDHEMGERLSRFNVSWSTGSGLGTLLSGILAGPTLNLPFIAASSLLLALGLWLIHLKHSTSPGVLPLPRREQPAPHVPHPNAAAFLFTARLVQFGLTFAIGSIRWLFPKLAVSLHLDGATIGILLWMVTGGQAIGFLGMALVRRWQYAFGALVLTLCLPLAGLLLAWTSSTPLGFGAAFLAVGLSGGMAFNLSLFYSVHGPHARGSNAGLHEAIGGLGWMLGPLLGGAVARHVSLPATSLLNFGVIVLVLAIVCAYWLRVRRAEGAKAGPVAA